MWFGMTECPSCNYTNPSGARNCTICGRAMSKPRTNPSSTIYPIDHNLHTKMVKPKMAVFDIDETLTDPSNRVRAARRAGYLTGEEYGGKQSYPKGQDAFINWFDSPERFRSDTPLPGAVQYVNSLVSQGYIIAYLTARREIRKEATVEHLKSMGFPIFDNNVREPLVYLKKNKRVSTQKYKYNTMRDLQRYYDIHYFFDDQQKNRDVAFQLGVIGVYDLRDRLGVKTNPPRKNVPFDGARVMTDIRAEQKANVEETLAKWAKSAMDAPLENAMRTQPWGPPFTFNITNKSKQESFYKIMKMYEGVDRTVGASGMQIMTRELGKLYNGTFEIHYRASLKDTPLVVSYTPNSMTVDVSRTLGNPAPLNCGCGKTPCVTYGPKPNPSHPNTEVPEGYREAAGCLVQRKSDGKILFLRRSPKETSKHGLCEFPGGKLESGETARDAALIETLEEAGLEVNIIRQLDSHVDHTMRKVYHCFLAAPKKGAKVKLSEEHDMYKWCSLSKKWPKDKLSHHARFMLNQLNGGALPNPLPRPKKKGKRKEPAKTYVKRMMGNTKMRAEFPDRSQRYAVTINLVEKHYGKRGLKSIGAKPNPKTKVLPILSGEPSGKHTKLGAVFAEVVIGRNIVKDVGEVVQGIYRGLIGGRTSMAEKRLAMGVASMQKELSDRTQALGGNAVCNLKIDYEMIQGTATITIVATADAIKMARPPTRKNPRMPLDGMEDDKKVKKAKNKYKKFHGGKDPENIEKKMIDVGDVWYSLGPCWSIGYMSPKETGDDEQKYIHHTNEDSKDGNFPMMYATMPENGQPMIVITGGSMKIGMRDGLAWLID